MREVNAKTAKASPSLPLLRRARIVFFGMSESLDKIVRKSCICRTRALSKMRPL